MNKLHRNIFEASIINEHQPAMIIIKIIIGNDYKLIPRVIINITNSTEISTLFFFLFVLMMITNAIGMMMLTIMMND